MGVHDAISNSADDEVIVTVTLSDSSTSTAPTDSEFPICYPLIIIVALLVVVVIAAAYSNRRSRLVAYLGSQKES